MAGRNTVEIVLSASDRASGAIRGAFGNLEGSSSRAMGVIKAGAALAITALGTAVAAVAKLGVEQNATAESSQMAWKTLLGTQEKAKKMYADIANFAKKTQFDSASVDQMAKYMNNAGYAGEKLFNQLGKIADVSGAFNITADSATELAKQMSQVQQAGVAYTEDLNILADRGVPILQAIAKVTGKNVAEVKKMASEGKITADIYNKAFDSIATSVKGAADAQSQTFDGMMSTLQDNLGIIAGQLAKPLFDKMKQGLDTIMPILDRFSTTLKDQGLKAALGEIIPPATVDKIYNLFDTIQTVGIVAFDGLKAAVGFVSDNFNILGPILVGVLASIAAFEIITTVQGLMAAWKASTFAMTLAQEGLNAALISNPIGIVITAIGLLVAAGVYLYKNWDTVRSKTAELWDKLGAFKGVANIVLGPLGFIIRAAVDLAENWDNTKGVWANVWGAIQRTAAKSINEIVDSINWLIKKINLIPGVNVPLIAHVKYAEEGKKGGSGGSGASLQRKASVAAYAGGTNFAPGGLSLVGEEGPELVELPRGAKVYTASQTRQMQQSASAPNQPYANPQYAVINIDGRQVMLATIDYFSEEQALRDRRWKP